MPYKTSVFSFSTGLFTSVQKASLMDEMFERFSLVAMAPERISTYGLVLTASDGGPCHKYRFFLQNLCVRFKCVNTYNAGLLMLASSGKDGVWKSNTRDLHVYSLLVFHTISSVRDDVCPRSQDLG